MTTQLLSELAKVRELSEKATPGEWNYVQQDNKIDAPGIHRLIDITPRSLVVSEAERDDNAAYLVAAVNFLRTHAAAIEGLAGIRNHLEEPHERYNNPVS